MHLLNRISIRFVCVHLKCILKIRRISWLTAACSHKSPCSCLFLTGTQLAVIAVHAVRRPGEDAAEGRFAHSAGPQQHHPVRAPGCPPRIPGGVGRADRVGGGPALAAPVRLLGGAGAGLGAGHAGGAPGEEPAVREQLAARVADAPPVELVLQAEAVAAHAGQHGAGDLGPRTVLIARWCCFLFWGEIEACSSLKVKKKKKKTLTQSQIIKKRKDVTVK